MARYYDSAIELGGSPDEARDTLTDLLRDAESAWSRQPQEDLADFAAAYVVEHLMSERGGRY